VDRKNTKDERAEKVKSASTPFIKAAIRTALSNNMLYGDIADPMDDNTVSHWGKTPDDRCVLLDYGLTEETWNKHYEPERQQRMKMLQLKKHEEPEDIGMQKTNDAGPLSHAKTEPANRTTSDQRTNKDQKTKKTEKTKVDKQSTLTKTKPSEKDEKDPYAFDKTRRD